MNDDPFEYIQAATRNHRKSHGCGAYTFEDGPGLIRVSANSKPTRILELGTALGYTACCLASGSPGATVDTIEGDLEHTRLAQENIESAGLADRITVHNGDFESVLVQLPGTYDLVFFDGFAPSETLLSLLRSKINSGGTLICANIGLAKGHQHSRIAKMLGDAVHWRAMDKIEHGQTLVLTKLGDNPSV